MGAGVTLAVDIGGTKVEAALVRPDGRIIEGTRYRQATGRLQTAVTFGAAIVAVCERAAAAGASTQHRIEAIGVGTAGPLLGDGTTISPINMPGVQNFDLAPVLHQFAAAGPIRIALDGTCIALAEHRLGALRGVRNGVAMVVSTGIGGGLVLDGSLVRGTQGNAGHLGQIWVDRPDYENPSEATVEAVASGPASIRWANGQGWNGTDGGQLASDYREGHPVAVLAVRRSATALGQAIAAYCAMLDIEVVAIGGGFSQVAEDYPDLARRAAHAAALIPAARQVRVVRAALGDDAPLVGAALLPRHDG